ncbi:hypothetical protein [Paenibacillus medicaginis]|uniref:Lipoprotein n=1 Tax=Paenibacillus medicaginis TaxID=1470560 RepID=A0ABV5C1Z2_9BACL
MKKAMIAVSLLSVVAVATSAAFLTGSAEAASKSTAAVQSGGTGIEAASVEHMKRTVFSPDGKLVSIFEEWQDTVSPRYKGAATSAEDGTASMVIQNGKEFVKYFIDANGNVVDGMKQSFPQASEPSSFFAAEKERYTREEWKNKGKVTENGVTYTKVTRTYTSVGTKFTETLLLNNSGLPVKESIYTIENGKPELQFNASYEYDKLKADKSLFDVDRVKLPKK